MFTVLFSLLSVTAIAAPGAITQDDGALATRDAQAGPYYWSFWQEGNGNFRCNNGGGGGYTVTWSGNGGFVCGKGWSPGGNRSAEITAMTV